MGNIGKKLGYIVAPLLTPFYRDSGEVNYDMAKQLTEHLISDNLCDSIIVGGSTGEFSTMSYEEMDSLMEQLMKLDNPYQCPHGRPTIISMTKYELEKKFKRVQ